MGSVTYIKNLIFDKDIASIAPSSRYGVKRLCKKIDFSKENVIVEYGPATGVFTFPILEKMCKNSKLIAIEKNRNFAKQLRGRNMPGLIVEEGNAQDIRRILRKHGIEKADYVLSGIPLSFFDKHSKEKLMKETYMCLRPEGKFLVYQFSSKSGKYLQKQFDHVIREFEVLNIPPLSIFEAIKYGDGSKTSKT